MTTELWMLIGSTLLLFVLIMGQQLYIDVKIGVKYALSNRDEDLPVKGAGGRISRAISNLMESLAMFTPVVLVLATLGISTGVTQNGAILFFVARVAHAVTYILGLVPFRSVAWMLCIVGIGMMGSALF